MRDHVQTMLNYVCYVNATNADKRNMAHSHQRWQRLHHGINSVLIGPFKIRRKGKEDLICRWVTMIDPATGWFEIQQYDDKQSITSANIIEQEWFSRYPWPMQVTFDRGSEFIGQEFQKMIKNFTSFSSNSIRAN
jgi:hypothetical protein